MCHKKLWGDQLYAEGDLVVYDDVHGAMVIRMVWQNRIPTYDLRLCTGDVITGVVPGYLRLCRSDVHFLPKRISAATFRQTDELVQIAEAAE
jgi:hypothetical protein